jgi:hypothetical protein
MKPTTPKQAMYIILLICLISSVTATEIIDLNTQSQEPLYSDLISKANTYPAVHKLGQQYNNISLTIDNYSILLEFENTNLIKITETDLKGELNLKITKSQILYLIENYQSMNYFQRFWYLFKICESPKDALTLSGIAMGLRGEV